MLKHPHTHRFNDPRGFPSYPGDSGFGVAQAAAGPETVKPLLVTAEARTGGLESLGGVGGWIMTHAMGLVVCWAHSTASDDRVPSDQEGTQGMLWEELQGPKAWVPPHLDL